LAEFTQIRICASVCQKADGLILTVGLMRNADERQFLVESQAKMLVQNRAGAATGRTCMSTYGTFTASAIFRRVDAANANVV
jgi:hypothetical protein